MTKFDRQLRRKDTMTKGRMKKVTSHLVQTLEHTKSELLLLKTVLAALVQANNDGRLVVSHDTVFNKENVREAMNNLVLTEIEPSKDIEIKLVTKSVVDRLNEQETVAALEADKEAAYFGKMGEPNVTNG